MLGATRIKRMRARSRRGVCRWCPMQIHHIQAYQAPLTPTQPYHEARGLRGEVARVLGATRMHG